MSKLICLTKENTNKKGFAKKSTCYGNNSVFDILFKKQYDRNEPCNITLSNNTDVEVSVSFSGDEGNDFFSGTTKHQLKANKEKTLTFSLTSVKTNFSISVSIEGSNVTSKFSWRLLSRVLYLDNVSKFDTPFRFVPRDAEDVVDLQLKIPVTRPRGDSFEMFDKANEPIIDHVHSGSDSSESEFDPFGDEATALVEQYPTEFAELANDSFDDELKRKNDILENELKQADVKKLEKINEAWNEAEIQVEEGNMMRKLPINLRQQRYSINEKYNIIDSLMNLSENEFHIVNDALQFTMDVED